MVSKRGGKPSPEESGKQEAKWRKYTQYPQGNCSRIPRRHPNPRMLTSTGTACVCKKHTPSRILESTARVLIVVPYTMQVLCKQMLAQQIQVLLFGTFWNFPPQNFVSAVGWIHGCGSREPAGAEGQLHVDRRTWLRPWATAESGLDGQGTDPVKAGPSAGWAFSFAP